MQYSHIKVIFDTPHNKVGIILREREKEKEGPLLSLHTNEAKKFHNPTIKHRSLKVFH